MQELMEEAMSWREVCGGVNFPIYHRWICTSLVLLMALFNSHRFQMLPTHLCTYPYVTSSFCLLLLRKLNYHLQLGETRQWQMRRQSDRMKRPEDEEGANDGCSGWMSTPWRWRLKGTSYFTEATVTLAKQKPTRASACCWRTEAIWDQRRSRIRQTFGSSRRWRTRSRDCKMLTLYMLTEWRTNDHVFFKEYTSQSEKLKGTNLTRNDPHVVPNLNNFHTSEEHKILDFEKVLLCYCCCFFIPLT